MKLELEEIELFEVIADTDDRGGRRTVGFKKTLVAAELLAKGSGWWGENGTVHKTTVYTDGKKIFEIEEVGEMPDESLEKKETLENIKSKLTDAEKKALGL